MLNFKRLALLLLAVIFAVTPVSAFADNAKDAKALRLGMLAKLNVTQDDFHNFIRKSMSAGNMQVFSSSSAQGHKGNTQIIFYDSMNAMQLALDAGRVDEIELPEAMGEYFINMNESKYAVSCIMKTNPMYLAMGFKTGENPELIKKVNDALLAMKQDGTLSALKAKYIYEPGIEEPEPVKFGKYDNVKDVIRVAVTGDLPPIDLITADGTPAGFNTAVLAEIGKRLKVNIKLLNINSGARAAALASGAADIVFWFQAYKGVDQQPDVPEGVTLSESYYEWTKYLHIVKK